MHTICTFCSFLAFFVHRMPLAPRLAAALVIAAAAYLVPLSDEADARVVVVIDRQDMEMSGAANLAELLASRHDFNIFGRYGARQGTGNGIFLVNGRRVPGIYLSMIPLSAVERVEILDEGPVRQSSYGIGSTVNIVLRSDFEGLEASVGVGLPTRKGMDSRNGSFHWGGALGRGHMTIGAMHFGRDELRARDRPFSRTMYTPDGSFTDTEGVSQYGNTVVLPEGQGGQAGGRFGLGDCEEPTYTGFLSYPPSGEVCGFPTGDISWLRSQVSRESLQLAVTQPLDEDTDVYVEARVSQGETFSVSAPNLDRFRIDLTDLSDAVKQDLLNAVHDPPSGYAFPATGTVTLFHRFVGHGNREWTTDLEEYEFTFGVEGKLDDSLGYDVHVEYYRDRSVETGANLTSLSLITDAIKDGTYDFANPLQASEQVIRDTRLRSSLDEGNEYLRAKASLDGRAFRMPGGAGLFFCSQGDGFGLI